MKKTKRSLFASVVALMLCFSMLLGTTYAWFTDSVTSMNNIIQSGTLDVEMYWAKGTEDPASASYKDASKGAIFNHDKWEPGYVDVKHLKIANEGSLALKYQLNIVATGEVSKLSDVIDVYFLDPAKAVADRADLTDANKIGTLTEVLAGLKNGKYGVGKLDAGKDVTVTLAMKMQETAGNQYQNRSIGSSFSIQLLATQLTAESDSFGSDYDDNSTFPELKGDYSASASVTTDQNGAMTEAVTIGSTADNVSASVEAGTLVDADTLTLTVSELKDTASNIKLEENQIMRSLDVHVAGVAAGNTTPILVTVKEMMMKGLNLGNYTLYHVENGVSNAMTLVDSASELDRHNEYTYDPATGDVTMALQSFSEVAVVADTENAWKGEYDYSWYTNAVAPLDGESATEYIIANADQLAGFGAIVGGMNGQTQDSFAGKTVTLVADVNLADDEENNVPDKIFYPIGYNNNTGNYEKTSGGSVTSSVNSFEGTFDGNGHTIANFYQNTWEMFGDYNSGYSGTPNHYCDAMGLFGYVHGGTVKNLTVDNFSSDGEFTPTGVIAAYAVNSTFENIALTYCNPRVYNTGNGGIVGIGGNSDDPDTYKLTFTNITIDNTNKITALWGSWDVACGGLVGMFRGGGHVYMTNCHVAAQIDVYNDVCGNYQYYWYRYSGMMVGTNKNMTTDASGYTVPETDKFHATDCTVHFGDWNDYYYCELVDNSLASYTHDHQFSRLTQVDSVDVEEMTVTVGETTTAIPTSGKANYVVVNGEPATENATCYHFVDGKPHSHEDCGYETVNGESVLVEDKQHYYLPFNQLFTGYGWGVKHIPVYNGEDYAFGGITILDREIANSVEKFETKFTGDFLYRVGNQNSVSLGTLFAAKDDVTINSSGVWVTIDKVDENSNVSGTFTANTTDWTKGTIQFSGTGVVKVTIQDYNYCTPTVLDLEVVDAVNATTATSATSKNVVLLKDCGFSSLDVSGGYTLYGNGFTMTCGSDSAALDMGYAFVTLNNGTLDNVQIVCPNFDYAALYKGNLTSSDNRSETTDKTRYFNAKSGVMASGNSQILNSRISGARAAVNVSGGNCVIDNSRIELGAVASILVGAANSLTLRDVTLVQKPTASTYDSSKTLMGFSVLYLCDSEGKATPTTIEGSFVQQAWVNEDDKQYVPSNGQDIVDGVMKETAFIHNINGKDSLNLGFAYMPEDAQKTVAAPDNITDNRTDKATIPYEMKDVKIQISILSTTVYVYSYKNSNGTADSFKTESEYIPNKQSDIITVTYDDTTDGLTTGKSYGTDGWVYELNVDLDKLSGYALDFSKLSMAVNGVTVTDFMVDGATKPTSPVAVTAGGTNYTLTATVNGKEYTATYKVTGTETSKESPSLVGTPSYGAGFGVANSYGGDWSAAAPVLDGITVKYWSVADSEYKEFALSSITFANTGKQNGTNNYWEYTHTNNDFTLKLTNTAVIHSSSGTYGMPVAGEDGKLYFTIASSGGFVSTGTTSRSITIAYEFTDNNGGDTLKFSHTWSISYSKDEQYNYNSFISDGTLTKLEAGSNSGSGCVTPDTLITLANGTQVRVDSLTGREELLVWNLETGMLDSAPIMFVDSDPEAEYEIVHLYFSDGTDVKVIYEHGFWDYDLNRYVYLDRNATAYVGHYFAKQNGDNLEKVQLVNVTVESVTTTAWSPVTEGHLCYFVNGMLSMPGGVGGLFNIFEVDAETMTYDYEAMQKDIETYGLFTYEELNAIVPLSEEMFDAAGGAYLKISIGKGNLTMEELVAMINRYSVYFV